MLLAACEQFLSKTEEQIQQVALETLEGHQRAIMGSMTVEVGPTILLLVTITIAWWPFLHRDARSSWWEKIWPFGTYLQYHNWAGVVKYFGEEQLWNR